MFLWSQLHLSIKKKSLISQFTISKSSNLLDEVHGAAQTISPAMLSHAVTCKSKLMLGFLAWIGLSMVKCVRILKELEVQKGICYQNFITYAYKQLILSSSGTQNLLKSKWFTSSFLLFRCQVSSPACDCTWKQSCLTDLDHQQTSPWLVISLGTFKEGLLYPTVLHTRIPHFCECLTPQSHWLILVWRTVPNPQG